MRYGGCNQYPETPQSVARPNFCHCCSYFLYLSDLNPRSSDMSEKDRYRFINRLVFHFTGMHTSPTSLPERFSVLYSLYPVLGSSRCSGPKLSGKRPPTVVSFMPSSLTVEVYPAGTSSTGIASAQNSRMTWRQIPQGERASATSVFTASATKDRDPSLTALTSAVRSAQIVPPYEAFSMFAPDTIRPSDVSSAAPTRNLE